MVTQINTDHVSISHFLPPQIKNRKSGLVMQDYAIIGVEETGDNLKLHSYSYIATVYITRTVISYSIIHFINSSHTSYTVHVIFTYSYFCLLDKFG